MNTLPATPLSKNTILRSHNSVLASTCITCLLFTFLTLGCEIEHPSPVVPKTINFSWEMVDSSPGSLLYSQPIPPFTMDSVGEGWSCGYLNASSYLGWCVTKHTPFGWIEYTIVPNSIDTYAYDIKVRPIINDIWVSIKNDPSFGSDGIYKYVTGNSDLPFALFQATEDPGMLDFYDQNHGVMMTRHVNQDNSALWIFNGTIWTEYPFCLSMIPGNITDISTYGDSNLTYVITDSNYIIRWYNQYLSFVEFSSNLYSIRLTGIDEGWLCTDNGLYRKLNNSPWIRQNAFPGEKAFSISTVGDEVWVMGEKAGERKIWHLHGGVFELEDMDGSFNRGSIEMLPEQIQPPFHGFILENDRLLERKWAEQ